MKYLRISAGLGAAVLFAFFSAGPHAALAQSANDIANMRTQIERLQRDVRDLQAELFRNGVTPRGEPVAPAETPAIAPMGPLTQRVDDMEQSLRRLTGELEVLQHQLDQLSQRLDRMQNQLDYVENRQGDALAAAPPQELAPAGDEQGAAVALAPPEGALGTIPQGTPLPAPQAPPAAGAALPGNPDAEFEAAMDLLTRAQYGRAGEAFRAFAASYPNTDLGAQALYWSGDIAYSVDKNYEVAAREFAELLKNYPRAPRAPEGMLKLGLSLLALGQKQEGCVTLAALPRTYPNASATIANRAREERRIAACG